VRNHPDDLAMLDRQEWDPAGQPCDYGQHPDAPTIPYGKEWICRDDLAYRLYLDRGQWLGADTDHAPAPAPTATQ
jgi:hypothetical protein